MKKCKNCGREFNDYKYYRCCPLCLKFVEKEKNKSRTIWGILSYISGLALILCFSYSVYIAETRSEFGGVVGWAIIVFGVIFLLAKDKKSDFAEEYLEAKIIALLVSKNIDVESTWLSSDLRRIIHRENTKNR